MLWCEITFNLELLGNHIADDYQPVQLTGRQIEFTTSQQVLEAKYVINLHIYEAVRSQLG